MGEAKRRQYSSATLLREHPVCAYCGGVATTTDHCPPRCLFDRRHWPEGYEFPACKACNQQGRLDEQVLGALARILLSEQPPDDLNLQEWKGLLTGLRNNQPRILMEWSNVGASRQKRVFRELFGSDGDSMRRAGWGALHIGPLTRACLERFTIKLGKALYYRHNDEVLDGDVHVAHLDPIRKSGNQEFWNSVLEYAPALASPERNTKTLAERFIYRFNHDAALGVMYAVVGFGPQLVFQIMALRKDIADQLAADRAASGEEPLTRGVFQCRLNMPGLTQV